MPSEIAAARPLYTGAYNIIFRVGECSSLGAFSISMSEELAEPGVPLDGTVILLPYQLRLKRIGGLESCRVFKGSVEGAEGSSFFCLQSAGRGAGSSCATKALRFRWAWDEVRLDAKGASDARASSLPSALLRPEMGEQCVREGEKVEEGALEWGWPLQRSLMRRSSKSVQVGTIRSRESDQTMSTRSSR